MDKLEYITGLAEMSKLNDMLSSDKPLTDRLTKVTEQLNHLTEQLDNLSSNTADLPPIVIPLVKSQSK